GRATSSASCVGAPTVRARSLRRASPQRRLSSAPIVRGGSSGSRRSGPARPPLARKTLLTFQPPAVGDEEIAAVAETIRSGWLTTGPRAAELEERFAAYAGAKHALAVSSGTAAMHLALVALGIGPGDEVITTPITWPATANVIVH